MSILLSPRRSDTGRVPLVEGFPSNPFTFIDPHMEGSDMNPRDMRGLISLEPCSQDV